MKRKHEEITALILIFGAMFANDDLKRYDELDRTPLTFAGPQNERQRAVVVAFEHAWDGYKRFAWGHDNVRPTSKNFYEEFHLGMTIIESLDTLYIMNLEKGKQSITNTMWMEHLLKIFYFYIFRIQQGQTLGGRTLGF